MGSCGYCHDNAVVESFFQLPKREGIRRHICANVSTAWRARATSLNCLRSQTFMAYPTGGSMERISVLCLAR